LEVEKGRVYSTSEDMGEERRRRDRESLKDFDERFIQWDTLRQVLRSYIRGLFWVAAAVSERARREFFGNVPYRKRKKNRKKQKKWIEMRRGDGREENKKHNWEWRRKEASYKEDLSVLCCVLYILTRTCTVHCRLLNSLYSEKRRRKKGGETRDKEERIKWGERREKGCKWSEKKRREKGCRFALRSALLGFIWVGAVVFGKKTKEKKRKRKGRKRYCYRHPLQKSFNSII
jgi:hypothetical protein